MVFSLTEQFADFMRNVKKCAVTTHDFSYLLGGSETHTFRTRVEKKDRRHAAAESRDTTQPTTAESSRQQHTERSRERERKSKSQRLQFTSTTTTTVVLCTDVLFFWKGGAYREPYIHTHVGIKSDLRSLISTVCVIYNHKF